MKIIPAIAMSFALGALAACGGAPREDAAENIEANAEMAADNLEEAADNAMSEVGAESLENQADATRAAGANAAEDLTTNDADTNTANGM
ncbi:MAG: hypothetical protein H0V46_04385 [Sphingomonas sp.]|nr:hypothetical protein [Sphingomonas sp.]